MPYAQMTATKQQDMHQTESPQLQHIATTWSQDCVFQEGRGVPTDAPEPCAASYSFIIAHGPFSRNTMPAAVVKYASVTPKFSPPFLTAKWSPRNSAPDEIAPPPPRVYRQGDKPGSLGRPEAPAATQRLAAGESQLLHLDSGKSVVSTCNSRKMHKDTHAHTPTHLKSWVQATKPSFTKKKTSSTRTPPVSGSPPVPADYTNETDCVTMGGKTVVYVEPSVSAANVCRWGGGGDGSSRAGHGGKQQRGT